MSELQSTELLRQDMVKGHRKTCPNCGREAWMQLINGSWKLLDFPDTAAIAWEAHDCNRISTGRPREYKPGPKFQAHGKKGGVQHGDLPRQSRSTPSKRRFPFLPRLPKSWKFGFKAKAEDKDEFDEEFSDEWS